MDKLCDACRVIAEGGGDTVSHQALEKLSTGSGVLGNRAIHSVVFRCGQCEAVWQRETDAQSMRNVWYLQARKPPAN